MLSLSSSLFSSATIRLDEPSSYLQAKARRENNTEPLEQCRQSRTVYVGKLTLSTTEEQLQEVFSSCGGIERIIMGLNAHTQAPTGFCFVVFSTQAGAENAVKYLNKSRINGRMVEIDLDPGFKEGRQFGRAENGAQRGQGLSQRARGGRGRGRGGRGRGGRGGGSHHGGGFFRGPGGQGGGYRERERSGGMSRDRQW